ncbi:MAG: RidA family protein [Cyclobacteriaceae bacterium]|nr:RidA family protein [Cyclobacteriaceae bacterium]
MNLEERIQELGLVLPPAPPKGGIYKPVIIVDKMLYVSGHGPVQNDTSLIKGKLGVDLSTQEGFDAARQVGLTMLSTLKDQIGDLSKIKRLVKTLGMVNSDSEFFEQPQVINGFSALMVELLGDDLGMGARSAVGMILPGNIAVEVEAIFEMY